MKPRYEKAEEFNDIAYKVNGYRGIAWRVLGWELKDVDWQGFDEKTGHLVAVMVGDDRYFLVDPNDVTPLNEDEYCGSCGQIGCTHDGKERE